MYVSMKEMLQHASVNNYAVPAPNCPSYALVKAACMAAAEKKSAVILDVSPRQMRMNATPEVWAPMVKAIAEPLNVPVALNLDHAAASRPASPPSCATPPRCPLRRTSAASSRS